MSTSSELRDLICPQRQVRVVATPVGTDLPVGLIGKITFVGIWMGASSSRDDVWIRWANEPIEDYPTASLESAGVVIGLTYGKRYSYSSDLFRSGAFEFIGELLP